MGVLLELAKARLTALVLLTTAVGYLAAGGTAGGRLVWTILGTGLAAGGANALNEWRERRWDALMLRTRGRPLPAGRLRPRTALLLGLGAAVAGVLLLLLLAGAVPAGLAAAVVLLYVLAYTPLKLRTPACTLVGAVCGAVPPVIGWTGAGGGLAGAAGTGAWLLGAVLFAWQVPHFMALAWLHRRDYERGGFRMLPIVDPAGDLTCRSILLFTILMPALAVAILLAGLAGPMFAAGGLALGALWLAAGLRLWRERSESAARRVFVTSLLVLPLWLGLLLADRGPYPESRGSHLAVPTQAAAAAAAQGGDR